MKVTEVEEKTAGGILLPSAAQSKPTGGEVVAIGNGRTIGDKQVPISIQVRLWTRKDMLCLPEDSR